MCLNIHVYAASMNMNNNTVSIIHGYAVSVVHAYNVSIIHEYAVSITEKGTPT